MNRKFIDLYNVELQHIRKTAAEFARQYPKVAGRLELDETGRDICPDPFVERLLEGFAFMAARVNLKLESEFPTFCQNLLETVYPEYLAPVPSMTIVRFEPEVDTAPQGAVVPRGTPLRSIPTGKEERTACTFKTAHEVSLYPIELVDAAYHTRDIAQLELPGDLPAKAAIRLRFRSLAEVEWAEFDLQRLPVYIHGSDHVPNLIYEQILAHGAGLAVKGQQRGKRRTLRVDTGNGVESDWLGGEVIRRLGFEPDEALLPGSPRGFEGYRLLQEFFALPQRFLFFEIGDVSSAVKKCEGEFFELIIALNDQNRQLEGAIDATSFELFATPAINLFSKQLDNVDVSDRFFEFPVVADQTRLLDYEIYQVEEVEGVGATSDNVINIRPFYWTQNGRDGGDAYFSLSRQSRQLTIREKRHGKRSDYLGGEVFISFVDSENRLIDSKEGEPFDEIDKLRLRALCTNRHLPLQMSIGIGVSDFDLSVGSVSSIRCLLRPTTPKPSRAEGEVSWRLISHLSLNYLSLLDVPEQGAAALKEILRLYADPSEAYLDREIEGVKSISSRPIIRRSPAAGPISFVRGLEITVHFDEFAFEGTGIFVLGSVLAEFFAKYVSVNSFVETVITSQQRREVMRWPAMSGRKAIV